MRIHELLQSTVTSTASATMRARVETGGEATRGDAGTGTSGGTRDDEYRRLPSRILASEVRALLCGERLLCRSDQPGEPAEP